jgi:hypothetical protein
VERAAARASRQRVQSRRGTAVGRPSMPTTRSGGGGGGGLDSSASWLDSFPRGATPTLPSLLGTPDAANHSVGEVPSSDEQRGGFSINE